MCEYFVILKGTNKDMAVFEFEQLWKTYLNETISLKQIKNTYYIFTSNQIINNNEFLNRLTLTNSLNKIIYKGDNYNEFEKTISKLNITQKSFAIQEHFTDEKPIIQAKQLAKPIWGKTPKVDLENPEITFLSVSINKTLYFSQQFFKNPMNYLKRMPKLRPIAKPYTLKSDMARTAINYLNLKQGTILDPFCGIGGILLEGIDMGFDVIGNDISQRDINEAKINIEWFYPNSNPIFHCQDSRTLHLNTQIDGIVTDIPYGKSSKRLGITLYEDFLINASKMLKPGGRIVIIYANFIEFYDIAIKHFGYVKQLDYYINKSMTRHILVLEKRKSYKHIS